MFCWIYEGHISFGFGPPSLQHILLCGVYPTGIFSFLNSICHLTKMYICILFHHSLTNVVLMFVLYVFVHVLSFVLNKPIVMLCYVIYFKI